MATISSVPSIILGGGSAGNGAGSPTNEVALAYQNLLSGAAEVVSAQGVRQIVIKAGAIGMASPVQIGVTETAQQQQQNLQALKIFADLCRANGIEVMVDAVLTDPATTAKGTNALVEQWGKTAAAVGLPIAAIENVNETAFNASDSDFANYASIEANAVATLIKDYANSSYKMTASNLAVGDMVAGGVSNITADGKWWSIYDGVASGLGMPGFSFVTFDTGDFAPWVASLSLPAWQAGLTALSTLATSFNMAFNIILQGLSTDTSANQSIQEAEQNAIAIAKLQGQGLFSVNALMIQSWGALPVGAGAISSPNSSVNEMAEINAVYPLYESGLITAQGSINVSTLSQLVFATGTVQMAVPLSVQWDTDDLLSGRRLGVVLIDQTGTLAAVPHGSGTVSRPSGNILVLTGDASDLAAELDSVSLYEAVAGPDTLDIEIYDANGRLTDHQVALYATTGSAVGTVAATTNAQGWISSSAFLNTGSILKGGSLLSTETLYWSTTGLPASTVATNALGESALMKTDYVHEPLAEYGIENASGTLAGIPANAVVDIFDPAVDSAVFASGGYANNAGRNNVSPIMNGYQTPFNPISEVTALIAQSTTLTFDPMTGQLEKSVDNLAPNYVTVTDLTGTHPDAFAGAFEQAGTQVTIFNTGSNPEWEAGWGDQFSTATLTYDGAGTLVEEFLQGGPNNPLFSIDSIFDPNSGRIWEQFQSAAQPPQSQTSLMYATTSNPYQPGYDTGPLFVTQFNQSNPNWNWLDWGAAGLANTEVWTDYFVTNDFGGFAVQFPEGLPNGVSAYIPQFVNGVTLDVIDLPGSINIDLNALGSVTIDSMTLSSSFSNLEAVDAWGATGTVRLTGLVAGGSTLVGGDSNSSIVGSGNDTIVAGAGLTTISTGRGGSTIRITAAGGTTTLSGDGNLLTAVTGGNIILNGSANTVSGSDVQASLSEENSNVAVIGNDNTIAAASGATVTATGTANVVNYRGSGAFYLEGTGSSAIVNGSGIVIWMNAAGGAVTISGKEDTIIMSGSGNELILSTPSAYSGTIMAGIGDRIVLDGLTATSVALNGGTLTVLNGTQAVASLKVAGNYASESFTTDGSIITVGSTALSGSATLPQNNPSATAVLSTATNGALSLRNVSNGAVTATTGLGMLDSGWNVAGAGNFYGNGSSDILFQHTDGLIAQWEIENGQVIAGTTLGGINPSQWSIIGTGDFYGTGTDDVLFENKASGMLVQWAVENGQVTTASTVGVTSSDWTVAAVGRLTTGAGADSILFVNSNGGIGDWTVENGQATSAAMLGQTSSYWSVAGLGDFTGNGQNDILFRGQGGEICMWTLQNGQVTGATAIGMTSSDWQIAGVGDYNGDGTSDILFRNDSGLLAVWEVSGGNVVSTTSLGTLASPYDEVFSMTQK